MLVLKILPISIPDWRHKKKTSALLIIENVKSFSYKRKTFGPVNERVGQNIGIKLNAVEKKKFKHFCGFKEK